VDTFSFNYTQRPDLINADGDKILLWAKKDNKTLDNFIHQYKYAGNYMDRREAIDFASKNQDESKAVELLKLALTDKYKGLRSFAINKLDLKKDGIKIAVEASLLHLAKNDKYSTVRGDAINALGNYKKADYVSLFKSALNDSSYTVAGNALTALSKTDESAALTFAKQMSGKPAKGLLENAITGVIAKSGDETMFDKVLGDFNKLSLQSRFSAVNNLATYLAALKNTEKFKKGIDELTKFRDDIPDALKSQTDPYLNGMILKGILVSKSEALKIDNTNAGLTEQVNYIKSKLPEEEKKGF